MNETEIRKYAGLMRELGLTGLEITEDNKVVRLERTAPAASLSVEPVPETAGEPVPADGGSIRSPLVGVFYAAPAENAPPYVTEGTAVKKGQVLCIIEAMKLMNEVVAEEDGVITQICAANGQVVEYGTELFRFRR